MRLPCVTVFLLTVSLSIDKSTAKVSPTKKRTYVDSNACLLVVSSFRPLEFSYTLVRLKSRASYTHFSARAFLAFKFHFSFQERRFTFDKVKGWDITLVCLATKLFGNIQLLIRNKLNDMNTT